MGASDVSKHAPLVLHLKRKTTGLREKGRLETEVFGWSLTGPKKDERTRSDL
jgi:hypothetical protein